MNSIKGFFDSFKEFIWDIIGFLIPGSYVLILLSACVNSSYFISYNMGVSSSDFYPYVFIIIAYLLGYVVYGLSLLKEDIFNKHSYTKKIEEAVMKKHVYNTAEQFLRKDFAEKKIEYNFKEANLRDLRSIAMSYHPEQDQKIYTFTFRSELSNHTANISIIVSILGLLSLLFPFDLFKKDFNSILLYCCLIIAFLLLRKTRNRFYEISMSLPFNILIAKDNK